MTDSPRGMPLLSGPPPRFMVDERAEMSCRKCNKEFNVLFSRGRKCNHCGYSYCHSCSDYQALMPRVGEVSGYDCMPVCAFCISYLQITAGGKGYLREQPLAKLRNYMQAYGLKLGAGIIEKDDIINAIITARTRGGCLPKANEDYYRRHAVPNGQTTPPRGIFSRPERARPPQQNLDPRAGWSRGSEFARPDLQAEDPRSMQPEATRQWNEHQEQAQRNARAQYAPPPGPPPAPYATYTPQRQNPPSNRYHVNPQVPPQPQPQPRPQPSRGWNTAEATLDANTHYRPQNTMPPSPNRGPNPIPSPNRSSNVQPPSTNTTTAPPPSRRSPPPPIPTLNELLEMPEENIPSLSVGTLKAVLEQNHVRAENILEKSELVIRVKALVEAERRERVHMDAMREREEWEAQEREWAARNRERAAREARERELLERAEGEERARRREAYRTTVESASESESDGDGDECGHAPPTMEHAQPPPDSASPSPDTHEYDKPLPSERSESPEPPPRPAPERSGLCVICQDEDANIAIVDCGHLALCRTCADLVWSSSRECPLCRTRIVTQQRLLRVFKT